MEASAPAILAQHLSDCPRAICGPVSTALKNFTAISPDNNRSLHQLALGAVHSGPLLLMRREGQGGLPGAQWLVRLPLMLIAAHGFSVPERGWEPRHGMPEHSFHPPGGQFNRLLSFAPPAIGSVLYLGG
jgi:hypothetical protein